VTRPQDHPRPAGPAAPPWSRKGSEAVPHSSPPAAGGKNRAAGKDAAKKRTLEAAVLSAVVHVLLIGGAGFLTVLVIKGRPPVMFEARKPPSIPPRKLKHSIRVKQMQKQIRKPQILQRLVSTRPSPVALPELPEMEMPTMKNLQDTPLMASRAGSELGQLGRSGGGAGRGLTGGTGYSDAKFFGQDVRTRAVVICMDISPSMVAKGVVADVRHEAKKMLDGLSPATKFNIVVFVDGATPFADQMVFATQENKEDADEWLSQRFDFRRQGNRRGYSGSTPSEAMKLAAEMGCDTMFVLSDDPPYLKEGGSDGVEIVTHREDIIDWVRDLEATYGRQIRINTIAYKPHETERGRMGIDYMKKVSRLTGGRFKKVTKLRHALDEQAERR